MSECADQPARESHFSRLVALAERRHIPLSVTLELSLACNLRCVHCYNFDRELPYHPAREGKQELTSPEIHRILEEVRGEGALFLAFTGGEPALHPDIEAFVLHAARLGLLPRLKSNGTPLTADRVSRLVRAGLRATDVSVYGATAPGHDAFVRRAGAFEQTIAGVRCARDAGIEVRLSFIVSALNAGEVERMIALAEGLGVAYNLDTQLTARNDGSRTSLGLALGGEDMERLYRGPLSRYVAGHPEKDRSIACPCARTVCGIGAFGDVYPCIGAPLPAGNLREQSFREIWRGSPTLRWIRSLRNQDFPACASCDHVTYCRRTSGVMYYNTGEFTGPARFGDDPCCVEAEVVHRLADEARAPARP